MAIGIAYGCFIMTFDFFIMLPVGFFTGISFYIFSSYWIKEWIGNSVMKYGHFKSRLDDIVYYDTIKCYDTGWIKNSNWTMSPLPIGHIYYDYIKKPKKIKKWVLVLYIAKEVSRNALCAHHMMTW